MKRRALLASLALGCGTVAGCGGRQEPAEPRENSTDGMSSPGSDQGETEWERMRDQFGFEERVDAVDDLGWDPNGLLPVDDSLVESFDRDVLIEVPPGEYKILESIREEGVSNWGIRGAGEERMDVRFTTNEDTRVDFQLLSASDILLDNFAFDQGDRFDRAMGMTLFVEDNLLLHNVEKAGANTSEDPDGVKAIALSVIDPNGTALVDTFVRTGPVEFLPFPENEICIFTGRAHHGTVTYRNLEIHNAGENGVYASKCPGNVHVEGGFYKNNRNDSIRISGEGSYVKGATVVIDSSDYHPDNRGRDGQMRGIRMQSGDLGYTGGLIEDVDLELRSALRSQSLVHIAGNQGGLTIRDSDLKNWTEFFSFRAAEPSEHVEKPWGVTLENVRVEEHGAIGSALKIDNRPNSVLRNVTVETPRSFGLRHGITIVDSEGTVFEDVTIDTTGIPLRIERPSVPLTDYSLEFRGTNEFSTRGNFGLDASLELPIGEDRTVFPFRDVDEDVSALLVTGVENERLSFRRARE
ncbi:hypothetical protein DJ82_12855 [Halorubrum sp. Ib24]|uniref:hypothetical protein n=1 Tax=Halorubrum sp. Ib24 TaxID=1383850 RepID=UPI000B995074|nr:hypothetical protein [Halorubrum sp. Ib24]OYR38156.1 hypothetical protein DJ82_12855 [Halorubrum sp. Ib24]